jgi:hypothetical protein
MKKKRDLFTELTEGFDALAEQRAGKRTLLTHTVKTKPAPNHASRACQGSEGHESFTWPVRGVLADARELGTGTRQAECTSRVAHSFGAAVSGHSESTCGDLALEASIADLDYDTSVISQTCWPRYRTSARQQFRSKAADCLVEPTSPRNQIRQRLHCAIKNVDILSLRRCCWLQIDKSMT